MVVIKTLVMVTDSSGARLSECIKVLKSIYYNGKLTDKIIIAVKTALKARKVQRHDVYKGILVRIKKTTTRYNGIKISFADNAVVLYNKRNDIFASRIRGPVCLELRKEKHLKILSLSGIII